MQHDNATPRIIVRRHARDRAAECCIPPEVLRRRIRSLSPSLAAFVGVFAGKGKVALMQRDGTSPVIRHTGDTIEVVSVLRPGQRVVRRDTLELWIDRRPEGPARQRHSRPRQPATGTHVARRPRSGLEATL
jgi:hypothetical protein